MEKQLSLKKKICLRIGTSEYIAAANIEGVPRALSETKYTVKSIDISNTIHKSFICSCLPDILISRRTQAVFCFITCVIASSNSFSVSYRIASSGFFMQVTYTYLTLCFVIAIPFFYIKRQNKK
jgi:hypothetical protein